MCINKHGENEYNCCCGCPLICGVIIIFALCLLDLASSITYGDIIGSVIYSILSIWFVISFVKRDNHSVRKSLYQSYGLAFIIFLIYLVWYCFFSGQVEDRAQSICRSDLIDWMNGDGCAAFADDFIWVFVGIYRVLLVLVRVYCVRILYYYAKEIEHHNDRVYHKLDAEHHGHHHDEHHDGHDHGHGHGHGHDGAINHNEHHGNDMH